MRWASSTTACSISQDTFHPFPGLCAVDTARERRRDVPGCSGSTGSRPRGLAPTSRVPAPTTSRATGADCLPYVFELAGKHGIRIVAMEVTHESHIEEIQKALAASGDATGVMLQIGTRNAQNFELLKAVGQQTELPVLFKRGMGITLEESLNACEYVASGGQPAHRLLPAGHEDPARRSAPQLRGLRARAGREAPDAASGLHRSLPLGRQPRAGVRRDPRHLPRHGAGRDRRGEHGARGLPSAVRNRRCAMGRRRSSCRSCRAGSRISRSCARPTRPAWAAWPFPPPGRSLERVRFGGPLRRSGSITKAQRPHPRGAKGWLPGAPRLEAPRLGPDRRLRRGVAGAFIVGWLTASWVAQLDRSVQARFEGQRFRVPSRVYTAPSIIYPGLDWKLVDLEATLRRLGYRRARGTRNLEPGQYVWGRSRVRVHLHAFEHPSRPEPARDVVLRLVGDQIEEIRSLPGGREMGALLLQPEQVGAYYGPDREQRELVAARRGAASPGGRGAGGRGPTLRDPFGDRPEAHRRRLARQPARGIHHAGGQHPHPAARQELLPHARSARCAARCRRP